MRASRLALAAGLFLLVPTSPALAAPDLTVSATHAAPTFLRTTAPNTTVYAGTLTLTVTNAGADPTDGTAVTVTERAPDRARLADQQPGLRRRPDHRVRHGLDLHRHDDEHLHAQRRARRRRLLPADHGQRQRSPTRAAASLANAPTVTGGGDASPPPAPTRSRPPSTRARTASPPART